MDSQTPRTFGQRLGGDRYADRSVGELVHGLLDQGRGLVRDEIQLAKAETSEKLGALGKDMVPFGVAAGLGLAAFLMLVTALNHGLTALLAQAMDLEVAVWLSPLLLAVAFGIAASIFVKRGREALRRESFTLDKTKTTLQEDKKWIQGHLS
jgi:hypothetical protein